MDAKNYQLKYTDETEAINDLIDKGVINQDKSYTSITEAVVWNIKVPDQKATYDEQGEVLTEATYKQGYHVDIMIYNPLNFGTNETNPTTPSHTFGQ